MGGHQYGDEQGKNDRIGRTQTPVMSKVSGVGVLEGRSGKGLDLGLIAEKRLR